MAKRYLALAIIVCGASLPARAEIYECVDQNGGKRFTNIAAEARGCRALNVPGTAPAAPLPSASMVKPQSRAPQVATPAHFPRVDRQVQRERDHDRRRILEQELGQEERLLADAKKELSDRGASDRVESLQNKLRLHENNVASLRKEISKIR
jgi:Domain of unknown function (DUF4124)